MRSNWLLRLGLLWGLFGYTSGCATTSQLQGVSGGFVGCPPDEIVISGSHLAFGTFFWQAACRGHQFQCSQWGSAMSCKELLPPVASSPPASAVPPTPVY